VISKKPNILIAKKQRIITWYPALSWWLARTHNNGHENQVAEKPVKLLLDLCIVLNIS